MSQTARWHRAHVPTSQDSGCLQIRQSPIAQRYSPRHQGRLESEKGKGESPELEGSGRRRLYSKEWRPPPLPSALTKGAKAQRQRALTPRSRRDLAPRPGKGPDLRRAGQHVQLQLQTTEGSAPLLRLPPPAVPARSTSDRLDKLSSALKRSQATVAKREKEGGE
jgi:hypothetical protein